MNIKKSLSYWMNIELLDKYKVIEYWINIKLMNE